jgi:hypothetical protein
MVDGVRCAGRGRARSRPHHPPGRPGQILLWTLGGDPRPDQRSEATAPYCLDLLTAVTPATVATPAVPAGVLTPAAVVAAVVVAFPVAVSVAVAAPVAVATTVTILFAEPENVRNPHVSTFQISRKPLFQEDIKRDCSGTPRGNPLRRCTACRTSGSKPAGRMGTLTTKAAETIDPHRMHGKAMSVRLVLSARFVFDASAYMRFPLAATPKFQSSAIKGSAFAGGHRLSVMFDSSGPNLYREVNFAVQSVAHYSDVPNARGYQDFDQLVRDRSRVLFPPQRPAD